MRTTKPKATNDKKPTRENERKKIKGVQCCRKREPPNMRHQKINVQLKIFYNKAQADTAIKRLQINYGIN